MGLSRVRLPGSVRGVPHAWSSCSCFRPKVALRVAPVRLVPLRLALVRSGAGRGMAPVRSAPAQDRQL